MVASSDGQNLYTIGNRYARQDIYRFSCNKSIKDCEWTKIETQLQYGRDGAVAFNIPESLAKKLCKPAAAEDKISSARQSMKSEKSADNIPGNFSSMFKYEQEFMGLPSLTNDANDEQ